MSDLLELLAILMIGLFGAGLAMALLLGPIILLSIGLLKLI